MSAPLDEDAPAVARVAVRVVSVLNDATAGSVNYPGLAGPRDSEAVMSALARLAEELQQTAAHLDAYLSEQLREQRLHAAPRSSQDPQTAVRTARGALGEVRDAAARMSDLLTAAELAMLDVDPADSR